MNKRTFLIALLFTFFSSAFSQNYFTVVVGTFLDATRVDFEAIQPYGFVYARALDGNLYQVMIGGFEERSAADQVRNQVAAKGYAGAFVQQRFASEGRLVPVIQIATRTVRQNMEWARFMQAGDLYAIVGEDQVKFVVGPFASMDEAKRQLPAVRQLGFSDAFVKQANTAILHPIGDFETGGVQAPPATTAAASQPRGNAAAPANANVPQSYDSPEAAYRSEPSFNEQPDPAEAFNLPNPAAATVNMPNTHPRVKRTSVLELQKALNEQNMYESGLDGLYGPGTSGAVEQFKSGNREFRKYLLLAEYLQQPEQSPEEMELQAAIDNLLEDPGARALIERSSHPIGKAYYAYMLFQTIGPGPEVNALMNSAIQLSYAGKDLEEAPPFDFTATYAYSNLTQVILHIHYIHSAPGVNLRIPCWIFRQHPAETTQAYATYATFSGGDFPLQFCDQFLSWEEVKALHAMAVDMNIDPDFNNQKIAAAAARRAEMYLAPQPVSQNESLILGQWNTNLWSSLDQWALRDPMNERLIQSFKVLYYQSLSRMEDYFLDKGFNAEQAKGMAMMTLFTVVGYHLERFV